MTNGIRGRIFTWLLIAIVPVLTVAVISTSIVENRLADRVAAEMANVRRLEATRISQALEGYTHDAERLAHSTYSTLFIDRDLQRGISADAAAAQVSNAINEASQGVGTSVLEARVVDLGGELVAESANFSGEETAAGVLRSVLVGGTPQFGRAYEAQQDSTRIVVVVPVTDPSSEIVGALLAELSIDPILELLPVHEIFGDSSEAYLAQLDADGNAEYITNLRFDDQAAFTPVRSTDGAILKALDSPLGSVMESPDYRGDGSVYAIETIEETGWGLAIKTDSDEAFGISRAIRTLVVLGSLLAISALLLGWALVLRPIVRRIMNTAVAAERVAEGDYMSRIDDRTHDEIGEVARGIDRLASDLEYDIRIRNDVERRLRYQATHDELTNIFNRQHMTSLIREILDSDVNQRVSLLFLDLDDFKLVNDLWGHAVGDEVLTAVANRLRRLISDDVLVSRWGGDEFTVVLKNADANVAAELVDRVRSLFAQPINTTVGPHPITCSVGVASAVTGEDFDSLLHVADAKMFEEKQANRTSRMIEPETARLVEMALAEGRIEVFYQPIVSLQSATETRIEAVEALVRIRSADGSLHLPSEFLPEVLSHRYAREIDHTIAALALRDLAHWQAQGLVPASFFIALNLSPASIRDSHLSQSLMQLVRDIGIDPRSIVLELSEEADELNPAVADELRDFGFRLAVDDLGLKRSNLDRLLGGGVDIAKIDRRWIDNPVVLSSLVRTCHDSNLEIIGEGVETMQQLALLFDHGVHLCQGYLISRPQSCAALEELLRSGQRQPAVV